MSQRITSYLLQLTLELARIRQEIVVSSGEKPLGVEPESTLQIQD